MAFIMSMVISFLIILLLMRLYCRLTLGRYHSQQDMTGKTVLITGASAGIGKATALDLARRNARILLACRNLEKAEKVKSEIVSATGNTNLEVKHLELGSFDSVRKCAQEVLRTEKRLDVLINNAGTVGTADYEVKMTRDGCERVLQINHFGHFLLTLLLLDLLKKSKPSRIINVSSIAYVCAILNFDDIEGTKHGFFIRHLGNHYYRSKLANILFTTELARRLDGTGVTVNVVHPGLINSDIFYRFEHPMLWFYRFFLFFVGKSLEEGAQTSIYLAVHPELEKTSGKFFYDCGERMLLGQARDRTMARKLFQISENIVGETYPK